MFHGLILQIIGAVLQVVGVIIISVSNMSFGKKLVKNVEMLKDTVFIFM